MDKQTLLQDIERFLRLTGMGPSYFGKASCGNSELVRRLKTGGDVQMDTAAKVKRYMIERQQELDETFIGNEPGVTKAKNAR